MVRVGVLALQGGFRAHAEALGELGVRIEEVRRVHELEGLGGLVLPGGESSTLLNLMGDEPWFETLRSFHGAGGVILGTCAGAILLAREVLDPAQPSLGLLDATIRRNGWGRQAESFEAKLEVEGRSESARGVFIRAPRFVTLGPRVRTLARYAREPVLVREDRILAATYHPELTRDRWLHRCFVEMTQARSEQELTTHPRPAETGERRVPC